MQQGHQGRHKRLAAPQHVTVAEKTSLHWVSRACHRSAPQVGGVVVVAPFQKAHHRWRLWLEVVVVWRPG